MITRPLTAFVLLILIAAPTNAQLHPDANDLAISFARDSFIARQQVPAASEFDVYVLLVDPQNGLLQVDFAIDGLGSTFTVLEEEIFSGAQNTATAPYEYELSLPECRGGSLLPVLRLRIQATSVVENGLICLTTPAGGSLGAFPALRDCNGIVQSAVELWPRVDPRDPQEFPDGCLVANPSTAEAGSAQTIYSMPEILGTPGQTVRLPLTANIQPVSGQNAPASVFAVEGNLLFDPDVLSFLGATLAPAAPDWDLQSEFFQSGFWNVGAWDPMLPNQPTSPPLGDLDGEALLYFEFEVLAPGTSEVFFQLREIVDNSPSTESPCCVVRQVAWIRGAITQDPVATDEVSFGALKARF